MSQPNSPAPADSRPGVDVDPTEQIPVIADDIREDSASRLDGNTTHTVVRGARVIVLAQVFTIATRFIMSIVLAILLQPHALGVVALATTVMMFLDQIRDMGTGVALIQREEVSNTTICTVFSFNVIVGLGLSVVQAATAYPIADLVRIPASGPILLALAPIPLLLAFGQVHHALLRRDLKYRQIAMINVAVAAVNGAVSLAGALNGLGAWSLAIGIAASYVADTALVWFFDKWRPWHQWQVKWQAMREIASLSGNVFFANLFGFIVSQADTFIVGYSFGAGPLGLYSLALRILSYPTSAVSNMVGEVTLPAFAKHQNDNLALQTGVIRSCRVVSLLTFPLMAGAAVVARPIVDGILGSAWHSLTPLIWVLAPVGATISVVNLPSSLLVAKGQGGQYLRWTLVATIPSLTGFIIGVHWSLLGACIGSATGYFLAVPFLLIMCLREIDLKLRRFAAELLPVILITGVMSAVVLAVDLTLKLSPLPTLFVGVPVGVIVYATLLFIFRPTALADTAEALFHRSGMKQGRHRNAF